MSRMFVLVAALVGAFGGVPAQAQPAATVCAAGPCVDRPLFQRSLRQAIDAAAPLQTVAPRSPVQAPGSTARPNRSVGRAILGAAAGAVGGFFGGGYLGAKLEGDCDCDDPGVKGFLIGAPIGGVVGGILGAKFLF